jgi:hypothetical protein
MKKLRRLQASRARQMRVWPSATAAQVLRNKIKKKLELVRLPAHYPLQR